MHDFSWTHAEKKIARRVFEAALQTELAEVMAEFKRKADRATTPDDMWDVEEYLGQRRKHIDAKYDYRYSQLLRVFGQLVYEGRVSLADLQGLSGDKLERIALMSPVR